MPPTQPNRKPRRSRIHVRPTLAGWLFLGIAVMAGMGAGKGQAPLTYVIFGGMMAAMAVSGVLARRMIASVTLGRDAPERVWQNQTAHLTYTLTNPRRRACLALKIEELPQKTLQFAPAHCVHLPGRSAFRAPARFAALQRGQGRLDAVRLSTTFPFGLVRAARVFRLPLPMIVWPAKGTLRRQLLHRGAATSSAAGPSASQGGQDEFFGLREYRSGDSLRWIHWRKSATRHAPVVREMSRPLPDALWLVLDSAPGAGDDDACRRRQRIRLASTLIDHAFNRGYKVGLAYGSPDGPALLGPAAGLGQRCKLLDALATLDDRPAAAADAVLRSLASRPLHESQVIVIAHDGPSLSDVRAALPRSQGASALGPRQIADVFEDNPLAVQQEGH